ncbi:tripartite tricarboxylate transporter TctB family protein [Tepidamorphus gemmatus]|uniref:Tripartite tricarboxylate transporter TctB family protein n=1 Tax=Tepidamorphus gemmatus TaxID=747076 RepID=A0A4R3MG33_9HYPH|nr:tripartite tricarboxylate transporter TctB family protein [Tepidamorphus gemmatus]TCT12496.1 tripartite tricarboxylate transporter TctB family protein [Tepidamorphus gemmatus]
MGLFWIAFGAIIVVHSTRMPIPHHLGATALTGPGLVPTLLGGALIVLGAVLTLRAARGHTVLSPEEAVEDPNQLSARGPLLALALMVVYAAALMLRQPFVPWTIGFIALFVVTFNWSAAATAPQKGRLIAGALLLGLCTALAVRFVFEDLFYIRLP